MRVILIFFYLDFEVVKIYYFFLFSELFQDDYRLLGVDLTQVKVLDNVFHQAGIDISCPTLILSECVLTYLSPQQLMDILFLWLKVNFFYLL